MRVKCYKSDGKLYQVNTCMPIEPFISTTDEINWYNSNTGKIVNGETCILEGNIIDSSKQVILVAPSKFLMEVN